MGAGSSFAGRKGELRHASEAGRHQAERQKMQGGLRAMLMCVPPGLGLLPRRGAREADLAP